MELKAILGGFALLFFCVIGSTAHATVLTGNAVHTINGPESSVSAYDQATVELVSGADVAWLYMNAQSQLNVLEGLASWVYMYADSRAAIKGGDLAWLKLYDNSSASISDGSISWLQIFETSSASILKADISWLIVGGASRADIYGHNFVYSGGHLSGNWTDGTPFSFWALEGDTQGVPNVVRMYSQLPDNIVLHTVTVPSTAYLILLALPLLAGVRSRQRYGGSASV